MHRVTALAPDGGVSSTTQTTTEMKSPRLLLALSALGISLSAVSCQHRHYHQSHHAHGAVHYRPGYVVRTLPPRYQTMTYGGTRYYYHNNVYYRPHGGGYIVVANPRVRATMTSYPVSRGAATNVTVIRSLPRGYRTVNYQGVRYYRHGDSYYQPASGGYRVVASPYPRRWR